MQLLGESDEEDEEEVPRARHCHQRGVERDEEGLQLQEEVQAGEERGRAVLPGVVGQLTVSHATSAASPHLEVKLRRDRQP